MRPNENYRDMSGLRMRDTGRCDLYISGDTGQILSQLRMVMDTSKAGR